MSASAVASPLVKHGPRRRAQIGRSLLALVLPVLAVALWQFAGTDGSLAGGALPMPDRVWTAALGHSAERVAVAILLGVPLGLVIG